MSKSDLQAKLVQAVMDHDVDLVIQAIRDGAEVDSNVICQAESALQDLEIEYADDTALYAGRTAKKFRQRLYIQNSIKICKRSKT